MDMINEIEKIFMKDINNFISDSCRQIYIKVEDTCDLLSLISKLQKVNDTESVGIVTEDLDAFNILYLYPAYIKVNIDDKTIGVKVLNNKDIYQVIDNSNEYIKYNNKDIGN